MSGGFLAVSFYKDSDGTTYQLDGANISPDSTGYSAERIMNASTKGTERKKNVKHTFEIRHNDSSFHSNLEGDSDYGNVVWNMVAAGLDRFILWYEDSEINVVSEKAESNPEGDPFPYVIRMISYGSAIGTGVNLLHAYARTQGYTTAWGDSDSNGLADILTESNVDTKTFTSGTQSIINSSSNATYAQTVIPFPITAVTLTTSALFVKNTGTPSYSVIAQSYAGASLSTSSLTISSERATMFNEATPSSMYKLQVRFCTSSSNYDVDIEDPAIRLNGSTEYIDG